MVHLPAVCDLCGTFFNSGFIFSGGRFSLSHNRVGPCPKCGGMGHVPDGIFEFIGNTIKVLTAPERTISELIRFHEFIEASISSGISHGEILDDVKNDFPGMFNIFSIIPETKSEWLAFLALVVAVIQLIISQPQDSNRYDHVTVNQVINNIMVTQPDLDVPRKQGGGEKKKKIGRNERCSCGSGKKFKKCCIDKGY